MINLYSAGMKPTFFKTAAAFRRWLQVHGSRKVELLVGFKKVGSGLPSMTWPQSVDEALCFGWIDGVRKSIDAHSYTIRFTPRKRGSIWSKVNCGRAEELIRKGLMTSAGSTAYAARLEKSTGVYSYEKRPDRFSEPYATALSSHRDASAFFQRQSPSYRRAATWWVLSAKTEATREKRLRTLIALSADEQLIPQFIARKPFSKR